MTDKDPKQESEWNAAIEAVKAFIRDWYEQERYLDEDSLDFYTELDKLKK